MLVPRWFWRPVGRALGRAAPGVMRAYYDGVVGSYVSRLARTPQIRAVYTYGSFVGSNFRPGRSDVDLVAVSSADSVHDELELLLRLRVPFRRYQRLLPIDLWAIPEAEFEATAPWVTAMRPRARDARPARAVSEWKLLAGAEMRPTRGWEPDERLAFFGDYFVRGPLAAVASRPRPQRTVAGQLAELERDASREGLDRGLVQKLAAARASLARGMSRPGDLAAAIEAALLLVDEHRLRHRIPFERRLSSGEARHVVSPDDEQLSVASRLLGEVAPETLHLVRSATLYVPPFEVAPVLLLESEEGAVACGQIIRWAVRGGAAGASKQRLGLHVLTSNVAEDSWRDGLTCYSLAAGRHVLGDPLAPRLGLPPRRWQVQLLHYLGFWEVGTTRWTLLGHRTYRRDNARPLRLAALRALAGGGPPLLDPVCLMEEVPELEAHTSKGERPVATLDDTTWARLGLELWRGWPDLSVSMEPSVEAGGRAQPKP